MQAYILAGFAAIFAMITGYLYIEKTKYENQVLKDKTTIAGLEATNANFKTVTDKQNAAIAQLKTDSAKKQKAAASAIALANNTAKTHENRAKELEKAAAGGSDCQAANTLLSSYLKGNSK